MKFPIIKSLAVIAVVLLVLSPINHRSYANNSKNEQKYLRTQSEAIEYIEAYANDISVDGIAYSVADVTPLESFTGEKSYVIFTLLPSGYAIYDEISGIVEEMTLDVANPYIEADYGTPYYGGPMNYIVKTGKSYISVLDNYTLSAEDINDLTQLEINTLKNRENIVKSLAPETEYHYMPSAMYFSSILGKRFPHNVNGTCTQVACCIMLGHYAYYVNSSFVPYAYRDYGTDRSLPFGTTESFHTYIKTFMGSSSCGLSTAASGLNSYFSAISFSGPTAYFEDPGHEGVYNRVSARVYANRSTVIAMYTSYNPSCTMNHSVVVYGYREELLGGAMTSASYFVHTGWNDDHSPKTATFSWDWFANDVYIN